MTDKAIQQRPATYQEMAELIDKSEEWAIGSLIALYRMQTLDERNAKGTFHPNEVGFNAIDAGFMSSVAEWYLTKGFLSPRQLEFIRKTLKKYCNQLLGLDVKPTTGNGKPQEGKPQLQAVMAAALLKKKDSGEPSGIKVEFSFPKGDSRFADILAKVKTLPDRNFDSGSKSWRVGLSLEAGDKLKEWGFSFSEGLQKWHGSLKGMIATEIQADQVSGLKGHPYPYQLQGISFIESRKGRALVADEMGLGKTLQALGYVQLHPEKRPIIVVCPASLKVNWMRECQMWLSGPFQTQIINGKKNGTELAGDIIIINYDILDAWQEAIVTYCQGKDAILIGDECFPAGTMITMASNTQKPIEKIKTGDWVSNAAGIGQIRNISKRLTKSLITLHLSDNSSITCTPNHQLFTDKGWTIASECLNRKLFTSNEVFNIMNNNTISNTSLGDKENENLSMVQQSIQNPKQQFAATKILRDILCSEMENVSTRNQEEVARIQNLRTKISIGQVNASKSSSHSQNFIQENERKQSIQRPRSTKKNQGSLGKRRASIIQTTTEGWKWPSFALSSENIMGCSWSRLENRISYQNPCKKWQRISYLLQSRHSQSSIKNMDRSRWMEASNSGGNNSRQEKRELFKNIRVERIEILELGNRTKSQTNNQKDNETIVFNLEVSNHPSYFVNDILVHNCHYTKNSSAQRTKAMKKLAKTFRHTIFLSGTPIVNRPGEFFNSINMIHQDLFPSYWRFMEEFTNKMPNRWSKSGFEFKGARNMEKLHKLLTETIMIRRKKADVLKDLPPKVHSILPLEMDNRPEYEKAAEDIIQWILENEGKTKAEKASRAQVLVEFEKLKQLAVRGKMKAMIEWISDFLESDEKLVVFATHTETLDILQKVFKEISVRLDGSTKDRQTPVDQFQNDPKIRVFLGNTKAAGVGITLTAASNVLHAELPWTPGEFDQASDRCHRIGQRDNVSVWTTVALNTIEEDLASILSQKQKVLAAVLDGKEADEGTVLSELINKLKEEKK